MPPKHAEPARGALAGLKADAERAKQASLLGEEYKAAIPGVGAAWSHNFLNQKPWHPLNFRNQMKVYEAQQKAEADAKARAQAKAEFDAEQEYIKTLSYLSPEEQQKHRDRQGVSFMYQKPPGYDAAMSRGTEQAPKGAPPENQSGAAAGQVQASGSAVVQAHQHRRERQQPGLPQNYVANMLGAISALQQHEKFELKHVSGGGRRSPPRGGVDPSGDNQQLLVDEPEAEGVPSAAGNGGADSKDSEDLKQKRKRRKLEQAEAYLRAAGIDLPFDASRKEEKKKKKRRKKEKEKDKKSKKQHNCLSQP